MTVNDFISDASEVVRMPDGSLIRRANMTKEQYEAWMAAQRIGCTFKKLAVRIMECGDEMIEKIYGDLKGESAGSPEWEAWLFVTTVLTDLIKGISDNLEALDSDDTKAIVGAIANAAENLRENIE
jgi:ketosteroid isomerase-like protein